ncbi:MAG: oligosaccharide flippase family protein [Magnetococcales bacterium]|nr:oligosaccharide flippase family protein [Nitrospirota bacterium]
MTQINSKTKETLKSLAGSSIATFATTVIRFGLRLVKNAIFTRALGPADRGIFNLLTTIPDLIVSFGNIGFGTGCMYLISDRKYDIRKIVGNMLVFTVVAGLIMVVIGYVLFHFEGILQGNTATVQTLSPFAFLIIPFVLLQTFGEDMLLGSNKIHFLNKIRTLFSFIPIVLLAVFWFLTGKPLLSALLAWSISVVVVSVSTIIYVSRQHDYKYGLSGVYFKEALSYGGRGFFSIFAGVLVKRVDYLFVSSMLGTEALGLYGVSVSMAEIILSIPQALSLPFLPIRLGLAKKDASELTPLVIRTVVFAMLLICLGVAVGGKLIVIVMFGKKFLNAYHPLLWLLPGMIALSIHDFLKSDMYSRNRPGLVSWAEGAAVTINIGMNYFYFIPTYGIEGAAISSSVAYWISTIVLLFYYRSLTQISIKGVLFIKWSEIKQMMRYFKNRGKKIGHSPP